MHTTHKAHTTDEDGSHLQSLRLPLDELDLKQKPKSAIWFSLVSLHLDEQFGMITSCRWTRKSV